MRQIVAYGGYSTLISCTLLDLRVARCISRPVAHCRYYTSKKAYDSKPGTPSGGVELADIVNVSGIDTLQFMVCVGWGGALCAVWDGSGARSRS